MASKTWIPAFAGMTKIALYDGVTNIVSAFDSVPFPCATIACAKTHCATDAPVLQ